MIVVSLQLQLEPVVDLVAGVRRRFVVVRRGLLQNLDQLLLVVVLLSSRELVIWRGRRVGGWEVSRLVW